MFRIERLFVRASLDDPAAALDHAEVEAVAGDESWEQWLSDYREGDALIVRLDVMLEAWDGARRTIELSNRGIFIEAHSHPPKVEQQIAEVVSKDFGFMVAELAKLEHPIDCDELSEMYVHVELAADVLGKLRREPLGASRDIAMVPGSSFESGLAGGR